MATSPAHPKGLYCKVSNRSPNEDPADTQGISEAISFPSSGSADWDMPGTKESEEYIYQAFLKYDSILIPGNGVLTIGENLEQAWLRLELVEHLAKIEHLANSMGTQMQLGQDQINLLLEKRKAAGLYPKLKEKAHTLEDVIASEIKKELLGINK